MQETEFNAVRLLIAPTHHRVFTKVTFPKHRESKNTMEKYTTYLYNKAEGYNEIIPHNNQAGQLTNKDKLINKNRCYH